MAKSIQSFREWAISQGGNVGNPVVNNYRGQCVSMVQQYLYQVFDIPYAPRGNAKDFVPPKFVRASAPVRAGDIVRWGASKYSKYGHIGMIDDDNLYLFQNRLRDGRVHRGRPLDAGYTIFRPSVAFTIKNSAETRYTIKKGDTFWGLENAWGIAHGVLQRLNPSIDPKKLQIGQSIRRSQQRDEKRKNRVAAMDHGYFSFVRHTVYGRKK